MDSALLELLQCPACGGALQWRALSQSGDPTVEAAGRCAGCGAEYAVQRGVAILLPPDVPQVDLWKEAEGWLGKLLGEQSALERALLDPDPSELAPADLFFRALALEERGDFAGARRAAALADERLYTEETRVCRDRQLDALVAAIEVDGDPVVDLASGRGSLVEQLAGRLGRTIVATDVSPLVLVRTRRALEERGLAERVRFVACDARRMPFRDGAVTTLTTHAGLASVTDPGPLLGELRRVVSSRFLAVTPFYREDDAVNGAEIGRLGLGENVYRESLLAGLLEAGFTAEITSACRATARPTPVGVVLEGAAIDGLPVAETELEWALVEAR